MLEPKPIWLQRLTPLNTWVTLTPHIYYPTYVTHPEFYPDIIAHEKVHICQQEAMGLKKWLAKYFLDKEFRTHQECEAAAAQIHFEPDFKEYVISSFGTMLNSATYFYCDRSPEMIRATIEHYLSLYHTVEESPTIRLQRFLDSFITAPYQGPLDFYSAKDDFLYPYVAPLLIQKNEISPISSLSNSKGRRTSENDTDKSRETSFDSWYQDPVPMERYLDRY